MYLSAERMAVATRAVEETFAQTSIAWQTIPHWDTGDPGQTRVRDDNLTEPGFLPLEPRHVDFQVTLAQAGAPTADPLLAAVMAKAVALAGVFDGEVVTALRAMATVLSTEVAELTDQILLDALIDGRAKVEDAGYRAPSCLLVGTAGLKALSTLVDGQAVTDSLLGAANVNALYRTPVLDDTENRGKTPSGTSRSKQQPARRLLLLTLGRRKRIARGGAAEASAGEEPVDIAFSVPPSPEVLGETGTGRIELAVRLRYALRIKDAGGLAAVTVVATG
ncbi:hypothetical protein ACWDTP_09565 [Mycobacterium sp. NPDC003449]